MKSYTRLCADYIERWRLLSKPGRNVFINTHFEESAGRFRPTADITKYENTANLRDDYVALYVKKAEDYTEPVIIDGYKATNHIVWYNTINVTHQKYNEIKQYFPESGWPKS